MKPLFSLKRFGNTNTSNIDLLIFLPHVSEDRDFLPLVRETATIPLDHISDEWLFRLLRHEADTGTREVTDALIE